jgi:heptosyltransferase-1
VKVLIVKLTSMGDVVHTLPALTDAVAARPDVTFDWCVESTFAPVVRLHPAVRLIHEAHLRRWKRRVLAARSLAGAARLVHATKREHYDLVIDAQGLTKSAVVGWLSDAPVAGFDRRSARERCASLFYSQRHAVDGTLHSIDRVRLLFGRILGYEPDLSRIDYGIAPARGGSDGTALLLHGTTWSSKRWPLEHWTRLARALLERGLTPLVTHVGAEEAAVAQAIVAGAPGTRPIGRRRLADVATMIAGASVVVGCDTGLAHLAAALGRPTLALFLSTRPDLTGVVGPRAETIEAAGDCVPCRTRNCRIGAADTARTCVRDLSPERVLARIDALLAAEAD